MSLESRAKRLAKDPVYYTSLQAEMAQFDEPFANLDRPATTRTDRPEIQPPVADLPRHLTYSDFRMDIQKSVLTLLHLADEDALRNLLEQAWLVVAFREYRECSGDDLFREGDSTDLLDGLSARSSHLWKVERAEKSLAGRGTRYVGSDMDKSAWTSDDHEIRFVVRVTIDSQRPPVGWPVVGSPPTLSARCRRSFWLLNWLRFIHKPGVGKSVGASRVLRKKQEWRAFLYTSMQRHGSTRHQTSWPAVGDTEDDAVATRPPGSCRRLDVASPPATGTRCRRRKSTTELKGVPWLTAEARKLFHNHLKDRLAGWGVDVKHGGTCVLVPREWANVEPVEAMNSFSLGSCPVDENDNRLVRRRRARSRCLGLILSRQRISLYDVQVRLARAIAWFQDWPRRGVDLDQFLTAQSGDCGWEEMHGSHRCHQGLCINPNHITWSSKPLNFDQTTCQASARHLRSYGDVPPYCNLHDPPCLLQFHVLRLENGLPLGDVDVETPPRHRRRPTFESKLPLQMGCDGECVVFARPEDLISGRSQDSTRSVAIPFSVGCGLCGNVRKWTQIAAYWSHIKKKHKDAPTRERLWEIQQPAREYKRREKTTSNNWKTWAMVEQALAPSFTWEVVEGWRLARDTVNSPNQSDNNLPDGGMNG
ncbi:hypothetical protein CLCR_06755 [Cladophialophora carrionii]|uniref:Zinc-binding loop region of homing endonuclease domain-containing protein n=1 Tax=Cladophialophora carrionii TaxID=86049 RepID=A0A1C1CMD7_9EURO|nr:hypothetical protein CLCR_06755 [Cladophialophora carrionii]